MTTDYLFYSDNDLRAGRRVQLWFRAPSGCLCVMCPSDLEDEHPEWTGQDGDVVCDSYRDDLRGGWHIVPSGVRFVAVKGVRAGENVATFLHREEAESEAIIAQECDRAPRGYMRDVHWPHHWCVLDLRDLAGRSRPVVSGPRYVVKRATDLVRGEPWLSWSHSELQLKHSVGRMNDADIDKPSSTSVSDWIHDDAARGNMFVIVDTHDDWHRAHRDAKPSNAAPAPVEPTKPVGPTPRQIVDAWDAVLRWNELNDGTRCPAIGCETSGYEVVRVTVGTKANPTYTTRTDYEDARRTVLADLRRASAEAERNRVVVDVQHEDFA